MNFKRICVILSTCFLAPSALALPVTKILVSKEQAVYLLGVPGCFYEITTHKSSTGSINANGSVGFTASRRPLDNGFVLSFICKASPSTDYCENSWIKEELDTNPVTLEMMKVRFYKSVNPNHPSVVIGTTTTAVNPPLPRVISFCFNNGEKVVEGWANIGVEGRNRAPEALAILKTLKIK